MSNEYNINIEQNEVVSEVENKKPKKQSWAVVGICISLIMAIIFTSLYGLFENEAEEKMDNPLETEEQLNYLYENSYVFIGIYITDKIIPIWDFLICIWMQMMNMNGF